MYWMAFTFGLLSSIHCLGMCGPIALAIPVPKGSSGAVAIMAYNLGRTFTYGVLGLAAGSLGHLLVWGGVQQTLSIISGILIITLILLQMGGKSRYLKGIPSLWYAGFKKVWAYFIQQKTLPGLFMLGVLNGMLPCGMVYVALAGALGMGATGQGTFYMLLFGLGTIPMMFSISYLKNTSFFRNLIFQKVMPYISLCLACLLILRGLNLNIPYVSPVMEQKTMRCSCSAK